MALAAAITLIAVALIAVAVIVAVIPIALTLAVALLIALALRLGIAAIVLAAALAIVLPAASTAATIIPAAIALVIAPTIAVALAIPFARGTFAKLAVTVFDIDDVFVFLVLNRLKRIVVHIRDDLAIDFLVDLTVHPAMIVIISGQFAFGLIARADNLGRNRSSKGLIGGRALAAFFDHIFHVLKITLHVARRRQLTATLLIASAPIVATPAIPTAATLAAGGTRVQLRRMRRL